MSLCRFRRVVTIDLMRQRVQMHRLQHPYFLLFDFLRVPMLSKKTTLIGKCSLLNICICKNNLHLFTQQYTDGSLSWRQPLYKYASRTGTALREKLIIKNPQLLFNPEVLYIYMSNYNLLVWHGTLARLGISKVSTETGKKLRSFPSKHFTSGRYRPVMVNNIGPT
jgi:hypothetical protein